MACDFWGIEQTPFDAYYKGVTLMGFNNIYYAEAALKITALGGGYFADSWCRFDFFLVCTSLVDQCAEELLAAVMPIPPMVLRVLRVFRILRLLRLLKGPKAKGIRDLVMTLVLSFPALVNVASLLALITFIYAVLGVVLFTFLVRTGDNFTDERNFEHLGNAFLLLFQCITGDGWAGLMMDATVDESSGLCTDAEGNCGTWGALPYFVSYQIVSGFVFLNLVVAVILDNFTTLGNTNPNLVSTNDIKTFTEKWAHFDPDADQHVPTSDLVALVLAVPPPMGQQGRTLREAKRFCTQLGLQQHSGEVRFQEVLDALVR